AMLTFAKKIGFNPSNLLEEMKLLDEIPFDYKSKIHSSLHKLNGKNFLIVSGSPEEILALSKKEWQKKDNPKEIDLNRKEEIRKTLEDLFAQGLRVIGVSYRETKDEKINKNEISNLVLMGFFGIQDALRKEVREAVEMVKDQGIKVVMITGDHKITAKSIAQEAGIFTQGDSLMSGDEIEAISEGDLIKKIKNISVFYRVNPDHKLRIISAYQKNKMAIAMTGDGVNDALSLSAADIGIGMGKIGTEVAKESSDLILLDDNFGNITYGVEEGKNIFISMKKVVLYLVSTSVGEVFAILGALILGWPLPILAAQILWLNLVTDGFLDVALALGHNPTEREKNNVSKKRPALIDKEDLLRIFLMALAMAIGTLFLFSQNYHTDINKAWTISLSVLAVSQWFNAWNCVDKRRSIFTINPFKKRLLLGATAIVFALQMLAIYNPFFQKMLKTVPLEKGDWVMVVIAAFLVVVFEEIRKFFYRRKK
ncbi:MAG: HAD-IC family P-type ATPase, partial [Candidatus Moraniibacteriota bacterium]